MTLDPSGALSGKLQLEGQPVHSGILESDLVTLALDVGRAAREEGVGVLVCIDELQEMDREPLEAIIAAVHASGQREIPFLLAAAGLPNLPGRLADAKSYAERLFDYRPVDKLSVSAAEVALTEPATAEGVTWEPIAVAAVIAAADGYPYFLQEFGSATWEQAPGPESISLTDAQNGIRLGQADLDGGFFRSRWDRATLAERSYLVAMAAGGDSSAQTADVAARLGRPQGSLGPVRAGLIAKGLIYSPEYGRVEFTVPGMASFVNRHTRE